VNTGRTWNPVLNSEPGMVAQRGSARPVNVLVRVFAPLHKRAFGLAVGLTSALFLFLVTAFHVIARPVDALPIWLLSHYFYGYHVTWRGAFIGGWWAFVAGFAAGWFVAFLRNLAVATWILVIRAKATFAQANDFLDHI
jgi:hypothetical protein